MIVRLHKNATTTPAIRKALQQSSKSERALAATRFDSRLSLEATLKRYAYLYNYHIPQKALGHRPPIQALKDWQYQRPELFYKQVRNHPGPDTYPWWPRKT